MSLNISPCDVREMCGTSASDKLIESLICTVLDKMGSCVDASYSDCVGETIINYAVCHLLGVQDGGDIKSERAANGSSTTFENKGSGEGLKSTNFGRLLISTDTSLCYNAMFAPTFFFMSAGNPATPGGVC